MLGALAVVAAASIAYPLSWTWGACGGAASPGAAAFTTPVSIILGGGAGDQILSVHEGRDDAGPYVGIEWIPGPGTNNQPQTLQALSGGPRTLFGPMRGIAGGPGTPPNPPAQPSFFLFYRPTNDPVNPGWAAPPATAAVGQLESATLACHAFADAMRRMVRYANGLFPPPAPFITPQTYPPIPMAQPAFVSAPVFFAEVNLVPGTPGFCEFYKYDIDTL